MLHRCRTCFYYSNRGHNIRRHEERLHSVKRIFCKFCNNWFFTKFDYYRHVHEAHADRCRIAPHLYELCWGNIRPLEPELPPTPPPSPDEIRRRPSENEHPWLPAHSWLRSSPYTLPIKKRLYYHIYWGTQCVARTLVAKKEQNASSH